MDYDALQQVLRDAGYDGVIQYDKNGEISVAVTFDSEQIKSATYSEDLSGEADNIGTFDRGRKDIRYQQRNQTPTADELGINKKLKAQNKKLRGDVRELRELLRLQKEVTHGKKFKKSSIEAAASLLMKRFELTRGKEAMAQQLEKFYEFIATSEQLSWNDIEAEAMGIVDYVNGEKQDKAKRDS